MARRSCAQPAADPAGTSWVHALLPRSHRSCPPLAIPPYPGPCSSGSYRTCSSPSCSSSSVLARTRTPSRGFTLNAVAHPPGSGLDEEVIFVLSEVINENVFVGRQGAACGEHVVPASLPARPPRVRLARVRLCHLPPPSWFRSTHSCRQGSCPDESTISLKGCKQGPGAHWTAYAQANGPEDQQLVSRGMRPCHTDQR